MITYNFKHRGPYEYDKFVLNIFQFHNEVVLLHGHIFQEGADDKDELISMKNKFDEYFDERIGEDSLSNQIYKQSLWLD